MTRPEWKQLSLVVVDAQRDRAHQALAAVSGDWAEILSVPVIARNDSSSHAARAWTVEVSLPPRKVQMIQEILTAAHVPFQSQEKLTKEVAAGPPGRQSIDAWLNDRGYKRKTIAKVRLP